MTDEFTAALEHARALVGQHDKTSKLDLVIRQFIAAYDAGNVQISSPEIGGHDDIAPHPWHEEWLHHAREAIAR